MKKLLSGVIGVVCALAAASAFADRTTYFSNNSTYDLRIWTMSCYVGTDGKQSCTDEIYGGYVKAGSTQALTYSSKNEKGVAWQQAGVHVTHAAVDARVPAGDPKGALTYMNFCNDIREDNVNGRITFDIAFNKVSCTNTLA